VESLQKKKERDGWLLFHGKSQEKGEKNIMAVSFLSVFLWFLESEEIHGSLSFTNLRLGQ